MCRCHSSLHWRSPNIVIGAIKWPRHPFRQLNITCVWHIWGYGLFLWQIRGDVLTWLKQIKPATWRIKRVSFKELSSIFSFMYQNRCWQINALRTIMVLLQLFWQMCQLKENFNVSNEKFYSSFTRHLNVSSAVHGRTDMKCTVNPYEKSRTNNHLYLRPLPQNYDRTCRIPLRYMEGNHWIERIQSRSTQASLFRNWLIHMNRGRERCSTNKPTIDWSVQPVTQLNIKTGPLRYLHSLPTGNQNVHHKRH